MTERFTGPLDAGQMAVANALIPASERSSVKAAGRRSRLLAPSTNEVRALVRW